MATYGKFVDILGKTENFDAQGFMEEWMARATEEQWMEFRPMPLIKDLVLNFAEDMATYFREVIGLTDSDVLYAQYIQNGHAFLREIHTTAIKLGIDVALEEIDVPLSMTDALVASGVAKFVPLDDGPEEDEHNWGEDEEGGDEF